MKKVQLYPLYNFYHILSSPHNGVLNACPLRLLHFPITSLCAFFSFIQYLFCSCAHVCICLSELGKYVEVREQSVSFVFPHHVCPNCWTLIFNLVKSLELLNLSTSTPYPQWLFNPLNTSCYLIDLDLSSSMGDPYFVFFTCSSWYFYRERCEQRSLHLH